MSTTVVAYQQSSLTERATYAKTLAAAGELIPRGLRDNKGQPVAAKILMVMETGSMLGLHPMAALQSIDIVEGRATLSAKLMKGLISQAGHGMVVTKTGTIPGGDYSVTVTGTRSDNGESTSSTWDIHRGIRAGSVDSYKRNERGVWEVRARSDRGHVKPWEAYAEVMPVWRAISDVAKELFADVLFGLYSTEEIRDSLPVADEPSAPSEDWAESIRTATTTAELTEIQKRLQASGEGTDQLRTLWIEKAGLLDREAENTVDAEVVEDEPEPEPAVAAEPDPTPELVDTARQELSAEEFERQAAAEFAAAMDAQRRG